jgi:type II secretory ATPase GspE/PulE/Tfp pilus assembly ATPase PilB-like protein
LYGSNVEGMFNFLSGLGASLPLFCSTAKMLINQRLVSRNCPFCSKAEKLTKEQIGRIKEAVDADKFLSRAKRSKIVPAKVSRLEDLGVFSGVGCEKCRHYDSPEKIGIFEILEITDEVKKFIRQGHFRRAAAEIEKQGNPTLAEEAFAKLTAGVINLEEFLKAVS